MNTGKGSAHRPPEQVHQPQGNDIVELLVAAAEAAVVISYRQHRILEAGTEEKAVPEMQVAGKHEIEVEFLERIAVFQYRCTIAIIYGLFAGSQVADGEPRAETAFAGTPVQVDLYGHFTILQLHVLADQAADVAAAFRAFLGKQYFHAQRNGSIFDGHFHIAERQEQHAAAAIAHLIIALVAIAVYLGEVDPADQPAGKHMELVVVLLRPRPGDP